MGVPMRHLLALFIWSALLASSVLIPERAVAKTDCTIAGVEFATCVDGARLFRSVIVAIPGWNGVCSDSFGKGAGNVLNVMRDASFFDVECFDYDSHGVSLADTEKALRKLLDDLQKLGYEEVSFVTHSTGGVLALQLLLNELMTADGSAIRSGADRSFLFQARGGLRVRAVYAWGMPINGIRPAECVGGWFINLFGLSKEVLPHLCADSPFLLELKGKYVQLNALLESMPVTERDAIGFQLYLFQGQGDDWVVNNIEPGENWFPANGNVKLVDSQGAHTSVIKVNGTVGYPTFSGLTMTDLAQLSFSLLPRTAEFFRPDVAPTDTLDHGQRAILDGVVDFASIGNLFQAGATEVSDFTVRLFNGRFVRSPEFDAVAVDRLDQLLRRKVNEIARPDAVRYGDSLLSDVAFGYTVPNSKDKLQFGGQSKDAVRKLAKTVGFVFGTVRYMVSIDPTLERHLLASNRSLQTFEKNAETVLTRLLNDEDEKTRLGAIAAFKNYVTTASLKGFNTFNFDGSLGAFGRANFKLLTAEEKLAFSEVLTAYAARTPAAETQVLKFLTEQQRWQGKDVPLWVPLLNGDQVKRLLDTDDMSDANEYWPKFMGQVIGEAGRYDQPYALGNEAIQRYRTFLKATDPTLQKRYKTYFTQGLDVTDYPAVRDKGLTVLQDMGIPFDSSTDSFSAGGQ